MFTSNISKESCSLNGHSRKPMGSLWFSTFWDFILNTVIKVSIEPHKKTALMTLNFYVAFVSPISQSIRLDGLPEKILRMR